MSSNPRPEKAPAGRRGSVVAIVLGALTLAFLVSFGPRLYFAVAYRTVEFQVSGVPGGVHCVEIGKKHWGWLPGDDLRGTRVSRATLYQFRPDLEPITFDSLVGQLPDRDSWVSVPCPEGDVSIFVGGPGQLKVQLSPDAHKFQLSSG